MRRIIWLATVLAVFLALPAAAGAKETGPGPRTKAEEVHKRCEAFLRQARRQARTHRAEVFMIVKATDQQVNAMRAFIDATPGVRRVRFLDHQAALREFKRIFKDDPDLIHDITAAALPESFRVFFTSNEAARTFSDAATKRAALIKSANR